MKTIVIASLLVGIATLPLVSADPVPCSSDCEVSGTSAGYTPPVLVLSNGADAHWVTGDGNAHVNVAAFSDLCLDGSSFGPGGDTPDFLFEIVGGTLQTTADRAGLGVTTEPCTGAVALPDGSFVLHYFCGLHPVLMKGAVLVLND